MKVLKIVNKHSFKYYEYPHGISTLDDFVLMAQKNYNSFVEMMQYSDDKCVAPYFVKEDKKRVFLNISTVLSIEEEDINLLSREEYDERLRKIVNEKCVKCIHYEEHNSGDNLEGHRENISLDGECWGYEKADD